MGPDPLRMLDVQIVESKLTDWSLVAAFRVDLDDPEKPLDVTHHVNGEWELVYDFTGLAPTSSPTPTTTFQRH